MQQQHLVQQTVRTSSDATNSTSRKLQSVSILPPDQHLFKKLLIACCDSCERRASLIISSTSSSSNSNNEDESDSEVEDEENTTFECLEKNKSEMHDVIFIYLINLTFMF